jgi:hypothetical protein
MKIYRMSLVWAGSISLDSTFKGPGLLIIKKPVSQKGKAGKKQSRSSGEGWKSEELDETRKWSSLTLFIHRVVGEPCTDFKN